MSLREMIENPPAISDVTLWRKLLIACALLFFVFVGAAMLDKRVTIYGAAPDHPVPATGQVFEVWSSGIVGWCRLCCWLFLVDHFSQEEARLAWHIVNIK